MSPLLLVLASGAALLVAYFTYGRWLSRRIFDLEGDDADAHTMPAHVLKDDVDYVPTKRSILFGHHFTPIAGSGAIVGPAIAVMWGWLPAILWVVLGSIFVGAVHDLGSLVVSLRNKGRSIGDVAGDLLGPRVRIIFLCILIMGLWIVLAIFGLVIAAVLRTYPAAVTPVLVQIPLAIIIGLFIHRGGKSIFIPSLVALGLMYASVIWGDVGVLHDFNQYMANQLVWIWTAGLLMYCYIASVLPVWVLLQPRDYINAMQLVSCMVLIAVGLFVAATIGGAPDAPSSAVPPVKMSQMNGGTEVVEVVAPNVAPEQTARAQLQLVAPMIDWQPTGAPPMLPVLFITIACGACSGFHCLVASGTTSKQVNAERDARPIAYGSMLTEGFLATLVIAACAAGIGLGSKQGFLNFRTGATFNGGYRESKLTIQTHDGNELIAVMWESSSGGDDTYTYFDFAIRRPEAAEEYEHAQFEAEHFDEIHPPEDGSDDALEATTQEVNKLWELVEQLDREVVDGRSIARFDQPDRTPWVMHPDGYLRIDPGTDRDDGFVELQGMLAFDAKYSSWSSSAALANTVGAFVEGSANFLRALGIPLSIATALMAVMVASFAATTLDTACRLQRYVIQEFASTFLPKRKGASCPECGYDLSATTPNDDDQYTCPECGKTNSHDDVMTPTRATRQRAASPLNPFKWVATTHGATLLAVITAFLLAMMPRDFTWPTKSVPTGGTNYVNGVRTHWSGVMTGPMSFFEAVGHWITTGGSGGMILWPLFGATNQLLAGFAFIVIAAWLIARKKPIWFLIPPALFMLAVPASAMVWQAFIGNSENPSWWSQHNTLLIVIACITLILEAWLIVEVMMRWKRGGARVLQRADSCGG